MSESPDSGVLYLVGTPIGHRGDLTPRAREVLASVGAVACEDTRRCRKLFSWIDLPHPELVVYHDHNAERVIPKLLARLEGGEDIALVADAGMPSIQDPGYRLVVAVRDAGVSVVPIPGPSALILALAGSGLPTDRFAFLGFAPRKGRPEWWDQALARDETIIVYETAPRVNPTLKTISEVSPARRVCLARELTKVHEEFVSGTAEDVLAELEAREETLRGEIVIVVSGSEAPSERVVSWQEALRSLEVGKMRALLSNRDLVQILSAVYPGQRNAIYQAVHDPEGRSSSP